MISRFIQLNKSGYFFYIYKKMVSNPNVFTRKIKNNTKKLRDNPPQYLEKISTYILKFQEQYQFKFQTNNCINLFEFPPHILSKKEKKKRINSNLELS